MKYISVVFFVFYTLVATAGFAQSSVKLYETEVIVDSQDRSERVSAIKSAFYRVLVKVTGLPRDELQSRLSNRKLDPSRYLQQFRYREISPDELNEEITSLNAQVLWVAFDSTSLNKFLFEENIALWGKIRPSVLVWLAVEDGHDRYLLTAKNNFDVSEALLSAGQARGLEIKFPLLDFEDNRQIHFADVWGDFGSTILSASERYQAGAVLAGRLYRTPENVLAVKWAFYHQNEIERWQRQGAPVDRQLVYASGVNGVADRLSQQFAEVLSDQTDVQVILDVAAVNSVSDYAKVLDHLREFETVGHARIKRLDGRTARYELKLRGTVEGLKNVITLGEVLEEVNSDPIGFLVRDDFNTAPLQYHLVQ